MECSQLLVWVLMTAFLCLCRASANADIDHSGDKPRAPGLSYDFYDRSCPLVYDVVRNVVKHRVITDPRVAAGLLRIIFHDCFVKGCDASILLDKPHTEKTAPPNFGSLRSSSLEVIDEIKHILEWICPQTVSCSDIIVLSARDAVHQVGGPWIPLPTGRLDSKSAADTETVLENLPPPSSNFTQLNQAFESKDLNVKDLVALSGAHTIGYAHCRSIQNGDVVDPVKLHNDCGRSVDGVVPIDFITPVQFDNNYFKNILKKRALFQSDSALLDAAEARQLVETFAASSEIFFEEFSNSFSRMSQLGVLTAGGKHGGEIRHDCRLPNHR